MRCYEVAGVLAELMLGGPRQRVGDRAGWHEVKEQAAHDLGCAIESLEEDPDLERGVGRRCDSRHGPSSTAFWMLSRHDSSMCSVVLRRHQDALVGAGSRSRRPYPVRYLAIPGGLYRNPVLDQAPCTPNKRRRSFSDASAASEA